MLKRLTLILGLMSVVFLTACNTMKGAGQDIQTVENRETIPLGGQAVALAWLSDVLELPRKLSAIWNSC